MIPEQEIEEIPWPNLGGAEGGMKRSLTPSLRAPGGKLRLNVNKFVVEANSLINLEIKIFLGESSGRRQREGVESAPPAALLRGWGHLRFLLGRKICWILLLDQLPLNPEIMAI